MVGNRLRRALSLALLLTAVACTAPTPEKLLADARAALAAGEPRTAEIHLKNLLQRDPGNASARLLLGTVQLAESDFAGAEDSLRRAHDLGADPAAVQVPLVSALVAQNKFDAALEAIAQGPAPSGANRLELLRLEGVAQRGLRAYDRAEVVYRAALAIEPRSAQIRTELAAVLRESGRVQDARELIAAALTDEPTFVPALLARGAAEFEARQFPAAEATFQQAVNLERGKATGTLLLALAQLAEAQLSQGEVDAAAANADGLLAIAPKNPIARYIKAAVEVQQQNLDGAEQRLESLIAEAPSYWPAHRLLGAINVTQNQLGQAVMYLRTAVTNNPTDNAARLQLAEIYIRQGDLAAARGLMEGSPAGAPVSDGLFFAFAGRASQQAGLVDQATQYFNESERQAPGDLRELASLSSMYLAAGEFERATRVLQSASFKDSQSEHLADYLLALVQARQGDLQAADVTARRLVEQQPAAAWPLNLRASLAMAGGSLSQARALLTKALELEPVNTATLLNLARVAAAEQQPKEAEDLLVRVTGINPNEPAALVGLAQITAARGDFANAAKHVERLPPSPLRDRLEGELSAHQGQFADAAAAFRRAYAAQPNGDLAILAYGAANRAGLPDAELQLRAWSTLNPRDPAANFALGSISLEKGEADQALHRYEAVLAANPGHAPTLNNLAWLYGERGDARAADFAERAHSIEPNNPSIADTLGWLHVQHGAAEKGLPLLATAAAALPHQSEVLYHWGVALAETGDATKALETLQGALASGGDFRGRDDAQKRVAQLTAAQR